MTCYLFGRVESLVQLLPIKIQGAGFNYMYMMATNNMSRAKKIYPNPNLLNVQYSPRVTVLRILTDSRLTTANGPEEEFHVDRLLVATARVPSE